MMNALLGTYRGLQEWWSDVLCKFTPPKKKATKILENGQNEPSEALKSLQHTEECVFKRNG